VNYDRVLAPHHFIHVRQKDGSFGTLPTVLKFVLEDEDGNPAPVAHNTTIDFTLVVKVEGRWNEV
jgi:hypothetical protein